VAAVSQLILYDIYSLLAEVVPETVMAEAEQEPEVFV
jgi:hypothetical protein